MRVGIIPRSLWRDPRWRGLSERARLVYLSLLAGPSGTSLPGLVDADVAQVARDASVEEADARRALEELAAGDDPWIEWDSVLVRLVREPAEPGAVIHPDDLERSYKTIRGWWECWRELPPSPLKLRHVDSMRTVVDMQYVPLPPKEGKRPFPSPSEEWARTFGTLPPPPSKPLRRAIEAPSEALGSPFGGPPKAVTAAAAAAVNGSVSAGADPAPEVRRAARVRKPRQQRIEQPAAGEPPASPAPPDGDLPIKLRPYLEAVAAAAGPERFLVPDKLPRTLFPPLGALVREYPTLEAATNLGAYLAAGYCYSPKGPRGPAWLATSTQTDNGLEAMAAAQAWNGRGRPPLPQPPWKPAGGDAPRFTREAPPPRAPIPDFKPAPRPETPATEEERRRLREELERQAAAELAAEAATRVAS